MTCSFELRCLEALSMPGRDPAQGLSFLINQPELSQFPTQIFAEGLQ